MKENAFIIMCAFQAKRERNGIKMKEKRINDKNGITLVALVITVVVMLILAGVAIAAVVDGDGLFNRTRQAAEAYNETAQQEGDMIKDMLEQLDAYLGGVDYNPVVKPTATIGIVVTENQTYDGRLKGTYNNPIIPKGFSPENENEAIWGTEDGYQNGLVIRDSSKNEFVWVPVDGTIIKFERYDFGKGIALSSCTETVPDIINESVENNGGFYIARYEAGQLVNGKPVSKQGATVYNNVSWEISKTSSEAMYPKTDENYGVTSTLIYGVQWDTALKFIGAYDGDAIYATDSTGKGNYSGTNGGDTTPATPATCGLLDAFRQKNIYDMAGNVFEWTMEVSSTYQVYRGGVYNYSGLDNPASYRNKDFLNNDNINDGFRVALYIK